MLRPLCVCVVALVPAIASAADSELLQAAKAIQAGIPEAKLTKAPKLAATRGSPTYLVWLPIGSAWSWPDSKIHEGADEQFFKWAKTASWRGRVFVTQFDGDADAVGFVDAVFGKLPNKSQLGVTAERRGSIVIWGDVNVVSSRP